MDLRTDIGKTCVPKRLDYMLIEFVIHSSLNINRIGGDPYDQFMSTSRIFALMI